MGSRAPGTGSRLRQQFPHKLLVGQWGDVPEPREDAIKDGVDRTLAGTRKRLAELHPLILAPEGKSFVERANKKEPVGTVGA